MHYFSNLILIRYRTLHVSDRFTLHHQESSAVYTAKSICHRGYAVFCMTNTYCCVHSTRLLMMESTLVRNCEVLYQIKIKFEKECISLVFIIRIFREFNTK